MFKLFSNKYLVTLLALLTFNTANSSLIGDECCSPSDCNRLYVGAFGGQLFSNSTKFVQTGTAFFSEAEGGPLAVDARGSSKKQSTGFGGVQIGYEWKNWGCSEWNITPAAELEAFFYRHNHKAHLINQTDPTRLPEHDFADTFRSTVGVYLVNGVFSLNNCCFGNFTPYVGGGVGVAHLRIHGAKSVQVAPPEAGVNHFNADRDDRSWAFAAQAKVGLRYNFCERFHIFAEYRYVYVDSTRFIFGSTVYPTHAPTSTWDVQQKSNNYNAWVLGVQFDL